MKFKTAYNPIYFLSSLGFGGLTVSFFMYLMFLTPHKTPVPTFDSLMIFYPSAGLGFKIMIILSLIGIAFFGFLHLKYLYHNFKEFLKFKKSKDYIELKSTNNEINLMSIPTSLGMSINVLFIWFELAVPKLWNSVEFLFPISIIAFVGVGIYALYLLANYYSRLLGKGDFSFENNNSFSQLLSTFAFAMVGVGLAAPAAMSTVKLTAGIAMFFSIVFLVISGILLLINFILGMKSILKNGLNITSAASIWIFIPIMTLVGIALVRLTHTISHTFQAHIPNIFLFVLTSGILAIQLFFGYIGYTILSKIGYFEKFIHGKEQNPSSYALICPGVGLFVFGYFFIEKGLIMNGLLNKFSIIHLILLFLLLIVQVVSIKTIFQLNKKMIG